MDIRREIALRGEDLNTTITGRDQNTQLAYLLLRATMGLNICIHGVSRILTGPTAFANSLLPKFQKTLLPAVSVHAFGLALPWLEAILGLLLLVGLRTRLALIGGALLILALTFGSSLIQDWGTAGLQLTYAAIYAALLAFHDKDAYSLDRLIARRPH